MARSGTSMVARLLNRCGLWLGEEGDLLPPAPDNPDGFWENTRLIAVNEMILSAFGGAWDYPPAFPAGWVEDARLADARILAADTIASLAGHAPWGWKDPRTSLTFPFWERLLPDARVILCLRNPLEVVRSLRAWSHSPELGLTLWYQFNAALLDAVPPERRLVTHYDSFFHQPETALRRLLVFAGIPATHATVTEALGAVALRLRHHRLTTADLHTAGVSPALLDLYTALCAEAEVTESVGVAAGGAGSRPARALATHRMATDGATERVGGLNRAVVDAMDLRAEVRGLKAQAAEAHAANTHLRAWAAELEGRLAAARDDHAAQDAYAAGLEAKLAALEAAHVAQAARIGQLETEHAAQDAYAAGLEAKLAALEAAHAAQAARIGQLETEHAAQDAYARHLEGQLTTVRADHRTLADRLATAHTEHATLDGYARDLEARVAALQDEHATLGGYAARLEERIAIAGADHAALAAYTQTVEQALAAARAALEAPQARLQTVEAQYGELHAAHRELAAYAGRLEVQLEIAREDHAALNDWAETLLARLADAERRCAAQEAITATPHTARPRRRFAPAPGRRWIMPRLARMHRFLHARTGSR